MRAVRHLTYLSQSVVSSDVVSLVIVFVEIIQCLVFAKEPAADGAEFTAVERVGRVEK